MHRHGTHRLSISNHLVDPNDDAIEFIRYIQQEMHASCSYFRFPLGWDCPSLLPSSIIEILLKVDLTTGNSTDGNEGQNAVDHDCNHRSVNE